MFAPVATLLTIGLYLAAGVLFGLRLARAAATKPRAALGLALAAVLLHAGLLYVSILANGGLSLGLTNAVSLVAWVVVSLFLAAALTRPIETLGVFIMPVAAATVLVEWLWPSRYAPFPHTSTLLVAHIIVSLLAYSLLSIAVVQSLMLSIQERQLHEKQPGRLTRALPPLQTMETLMFQMIGLGFFLLTITLITGIFFSEEVFGRPLAFTHHIVLSLIAWLVFAILLFGRVKFGWRGQHAARWALAGFTLLVLAYFGTKFVFEIVIGR